METYQQGYDDGYKDCSIMLNPVKTNGHTFEFYLATKAKYKSSIYAIAPTEYQRGYGDGFDAKAVEHGYSIFF